jgi:PhnB protein
MVQTARYGAGGGESRRVFQSAISADAKQVMPVEDKEYGWRVGRVLDPFGHHWEIGKPL